MPSAGAGKCSRSSLGCPSVIVRSLVCASTWDRLKPLDDPTYAARVRRSWPAMARRFVATCVALGIVLSAVPPSATAANSKAGRLAARYSPVVALRKQEEQCGSGEAYRPTSVDLVLGNPEVTLRNSEGRLVKKAPTGSD